MQKSKLIHNPNCSKSRAAKSILEERGVEFITINYLENGLTEELLLQLSGLLNLSFEQMVRTKEVTYSELNLSGRFLTDKEWISILLEYPNLIERPIFIHRARAIIGRPPELVLEIL